MTTKNSGDAGRPGAGKDRHDVTCPFCKGRLGIDVETGAIVDAKPAPPQKKDFETALGDVHAASERRDADFQRAFKVEGKRNDILERKFEKAREEAEKDPRPRVNPLDID